MMLGTRSLPRLLSVASRSCAPKTPFTYNHLLSKGCHNNSSFGKISPPTQCCTSRTLSTYTPLPSSSPSSKKRTPKEKSKKLKGRGRQSYRFVDRTRVQVSGGSGGNGSTSMFHIGRKRKRRPDGGHGGNGGSIVIVADPSQQSLRWTRPHVTADAGSHGGSQGKNGRNGKNTILRVPCGVVVRQVLEYDEHYDSKSKRIIKISHALADHTTNDEESSELHGGRSSLTTSSSFDDYYPESGISQRQMQAGGYLASLDYDSDEEDTSEDYDYDDSSDTPIITPTSVTAWGEREKVEIADLDKPGSHIVVATGGRGGYGNITFASTNGPLPPPEVFKEYAEPEAGVTCRLELELKLIADIGLVGFPNAGKSSLLSATSRATPYIAPYPFTTLNPLVGYIEYKDGFRVCAADVPGLIAGASEGKGKGHDFLRHLERTKALLYIVDAAGIDGRDPIEDFEVLIQELSAYRDGDMLNRRCLVVANKIDLLLEDEREEISSKLQEKAEEAGIRMETDVIRISAGATGEGLPSLTKAIRNTVLSSERENLTKEHAW
jgi:GTP-binding protein